MMRPRTESASMTGPEFDALLDELGYGRKSYPPNGRLNHWPSGKLFDPVDYYWIKDFAERVLSRRATTPAAADDEALPPESQRVADGLLEIAKTLPIGSASIVRRAAQLLVGDGATEMNRG